MKEKVVLRKGNPVGRPLNEDVNQVIEIPGKGVVAEAVNYFGVELTFFHLGWMSDPELKKRPWYDGVPTNMMHETVPEEVIGSIRKYGGFYISRHPICKLQRSDVYSFGGGEPATGMKLEEAEHLLQNWGLQGLGGSVMFGCVYDTVCQWILETGAMTKEELLNSPEDIAGQNAIMHRDLGGWCLYDILCKVFSMELTKEMYADGGIITRGGTPHNTGEYIHPARAAYVYNAEHPHPDAVVHGFFYIKD